MSHQLSRVAACIVVALIVGSAAATSVGAVRHGAGFTPAGSSDYGMLTLITVGLLLACAGLVLYWRQPTRTSWALLPIAAVAWFVAEWASPGAAPGWVFSTGLALNGIAAAVICHIALAFPGACPRGRAAYFIVAVGYVVSIVLLGIVPALTYAPRSAGCLTCAENLWLIRDNTALSEQWTRIGLMCAIVWAGAVIGLLGWRLLRSSPARRRLTGPVQAAGLLYLLLVAAAFAHGLRDGYPASDPTFVQLWLGQAGALALLATAILLGLAVDRRAYRSMASLSLTLGSPTGTEGLATSLSSRLRDPGLRIIYRDGDRYVDANGSAVDLRALAVGRLATPLPRDGPEVATIVHRRGVLDSPYAVADLFAAIHLALENERLHAIALAQLADLRSTGRRLVSAGDEARSRLERDLHDGAQQRLIGITLGLRVLRSRTTAGTYDLDAAEDEMRAAIGDLRLLARGLYPAVLRESGLRAAIVALSERRLVRAPDLPPVRCSPVVEATAYLLVLRASAAAPVTVTATTGDSLVVTVLMDDHHEPLDLGEVQDRATALDGHLTASPTPTGTRIVLTLPRSPAEDGTISPRG